MPLPVSLQAVVNELETMTTGMTVYLCRTTGEFIMVADEDMKAAERGDTLDDYEDWQQDAIRAATAVQSASSDYLPLPSEHDIDEYSLMESFCRSVEDERLRDELLRRIRGSGAFRRFKEMIHRYDLADAWHAFRHAALTQVSAAWLEDNHIAYVRP